MTFFESWLTLFGGITLFVLALVLLDWWGRRQERRKQGLSR